MVQTQFSFWRMTVSIKNILFVALTWCLLGMSWVFAVIHIAPSLFRAVNVQMIRHEAVKRQHEVAKRHETKQNVQMKQHTTKSIMNPFDELGFGSVIEVPPTWPLWTVLVVGFPVAFASEFPFWTIVGGIGCVTWGYLLTGKLMQRYRHSVGQEGFLESNRRTYSRLRATKSQ